MIELLLGELLATFPFRVFAYVPFRDNLRIQKKLLPLLLLFVEAVNLYAFYLLVINGAPTKLSQLISIPISCIVFFSLIKMNKGKVAFIYIFITAYIMMARGFVTFTESLLFSKVGEEPLLHGVAVFAIFLLTVPLMYKFIMKTAHIVFEIDAPKLWRTIWTLPLFNLLLVLVFTYNINQTTQAVYLLSRIMLMACMFVVYYHVVQSVRSFKKRIEHEDHIQSLNQIAQMQASQYTLLKTHVAEARRAKHDLRQHLKAIQGYIDKDDKASLEEYIKAYGETIPPDTVRSFCKNPAVDSILRYYAERCLQMEIDMEIVFQMGDKTIIPEPEFCILIGNLIENALESCKRMHGKTFIRVHALQTGHSMLSITMDNSSLEPPVWKDGKLQSSKRFEPGIGTETMKAIAERYNGDCRFDWKDGVFYTSVLLNP